MAKAKKIVFKTKDGKEVSFKKKPGAAKVKKENKIKTMEKRLSMMEKAVIQYNKSVREHQEKRKEEKKNRKVVDLSSLVKTKVGEKKVQARDSDSD